MAGAAAEAEIMALATKGATAQGLDRWSLIVGHVELMRLLLDRFGLDSRTQRFLLNHLHLLAESGKAAVLDQLDKLLLGEHGFDDDAASEGVSELGTQQMLDVLLDATQHGVTMGGRSRHDIVRRLIQKRRRAGERTQIVAALDFLQEWIAISAPPNEAFVKIAALIGDDQPDAARVLAAWRSVIDLLGAYGIAQDRIQIQPGLARSWDYYTGIVFELWSGNRHFGGGGRYDDLTHLVGGEHSVPAVGFAYYVDQLLLALPEPPAAKRRTLAIVAAPDAYPAAIQWAETLRARGCTVVLFDTEAQADDPFVAQSNGNLRHGDHVYSSYEALALELEMTP